MDHPTHLHFLFSLKTGGILASTIAPPIYPTRGPLPCGATGHVFCLSLISSRFEISLSVKEQLHLCVSGLVLTCCIDFGDLCTCLASVFPLTLSLLPLSNPWQCFAPQVWAVSSGLPASAVPWSTEETTTFSTRGEVTLTPTTLRNIGPLIPRTLASLSSWTTALPDRPP